jgi:hypothetical protein
VGFIAALGQVKVAGVNRALVVLFIAVVGMGIVGQMGIHAEATSANADENSFAPVENSILDFSVSGSAGRDLVQVTSAGGTVRISGTDYRVWPWHYVKGDFATGPIWIVFLANVTSDNFRIMFLYLTNYTTVFALRIFDYETGTFQTRPFQGNHFISEELVPAPHPTPIPLAIIPEAKSASEMSVLGSHIYVNDHSGTAFEGPDELTIYPVYNQIFDEDGMFSELWALLKARDGSLYFSIFYAQVGKDGTVYRGHTLRLSDYAYMDWYTYNARWKKGQFPGEVKVRTNLENVVVTLDGFPFRTGKDGSLNVQVPIGPLEVRIQDSIQMEQGVRQVFSGWNDGSAQNPRTLEVEGGKTKTLTASFKQQYLLNVRGVTDPYNATAWYDSGRSVQVEVPSTIDYGNGTRQVFTGWTGDVQSSDPRISLTLDSPKSIEANWKLQHLLTVELSGLPDGTTVWLKINDWVREVASSQGHTEWIDAGTSVNIAPEQNEIVVRGEAFSLDSWVDDSGQPVTLPLGVNAPMRVRGNYRLASVYESSLEIHPSAQSIAYGNELEIPGQLSPQVDAADVFLYMSQDNSTWTQIGQTLTGSDGRFAFEWKPPSKGTFFLQAKWTGNNALRGSISDVQAVNVIEYTGPISEPLNSLQDQLQRIAKTNANVNTAYVILAGPAIAILDIAEKAAPVMVADPVASQIMYFAITGFLLGAVYLLPPGVIVSAIRTLRRHRAAGLKGTIIVLSLWTVMLALSFVVVVGVLALPVALLSVLFVMVLFTSAMILPALISLSISHILAP